MDEFTQDLLAFRARKDAFFRSGRGPLSGAPLGAFAGLSYYPPDPAYRLTLPIEPAQDEEVTELGTSDGGLRPMRRLGRVRLKLPGGEGWLSLFAPAGDPEPTEAFVPFRDATSGGETYGAGRYLEAELQGDHATLDFNRAYHPYCAYGEGWSCPLPPAENALAFPLRAGERLPEQSTTEAPGSGG